MVKTIKFPAYEISREHWHSYGVWYVVNRKDGSVIKIETPKLVSGKKPEFRLHFRSSIYLLVERNVLISRRESEHIIKRLDSYEDLTQQHINILEGIVGK